jgi:hypothetical protein
MSLLKKKYSNYYRNSNKKCVLVDVLLPNYLKLDTELARLEQEKVAINKAKKAAVNAMLTAYIKRERFCK